jgi:hypothetical protein
LNHEAEQLELKTLYSSKNNVKNQFKKSVLGSSIIALILVIVVNLNYYQSDSSMAIDISEKADENCNSFYFNDVSNLPPRDNILNVINGNQKFAKKKIKAVN